MLIQKELLSIGEVSLVTGIPIHTIRFWESEFNRFITPARTIGRQRRYTEIEVNRILEIKKLLKEDKYSIAGAKQVLSARPESGEAGNALARVQGLEQSTPKALFGLSDMPLG